MHRRIFVIAITSLILTGCGSDTAVTAGRKAEFTAHDAPEISVSKDYKVKNGGTFKLSDKCSSKAVMTYTGKVNTKQEGSYDICVTATDDEGNITIKNTSVAVAKAPEPVSTPTPTPSADTENKQNESGNNHTANNTDSSYRSNTVSQQNTQPSANSPSSSNVITPQNNNTSSGSETGSDAPPTVNDNTGGNTGSNEPSSQVTDGGTCQAYVNQYGGSCYPMADGSGYLYSR